MANHCIDVVCAGCGFVWDEQCCVGFPVLSESTIHGDKDPQLGPKSVWERIGEDS